MMAAESPGAQRIIKHLAGRSVREMLHFHCSSAHQQVSRLRLVCRMHPRRQCPSMDNNSESGIVFDRILMQSGYNHFENQMHPWPLPC